MNSVAEHPRNIVEPDYNLAFNDIARVFRYAMYPKRALDLGCGRGELLREFIGLDIYAVGVDKDESLQELMPDSIICGDVTDSVYYLEETFDLVTCFGLVDILDRTELSNLFEFFNAHIEPGGHLVIAPRVQASHKRYSVSYLVQGLRFVVRYSPYHSYVLEKCLAQSSHIVKYPWLVDDIIVFTKAKNKKPVNLEKLEVSDLRIKEIMLKVKLDEQRKPR